MHQADDGTYRKLAYNLANFMQTLALSEAVKQGSLTSLREKLVKIGAKIGRYVVFQLTEVAVPRELFQGMLRLICGTVPTRGRRRREAVDRIACESKRKEACALMAEKADVWGTNCGRFTTVAGE